MKRILLRTTGYTLAIIGFILGFTSKVVAQYGAWVASYRYMGHVKSEICNEPLSGIKVTMNDTKDNILSEAVTDESGQFNISYRSYYDEEKLYLKFTDDDGKKNKGEFISFSEAVGAYDEKPREIIMKYKGKVPCVEKPVAQNEKPITIEILPVAVSDSIETNTPQATIDSTVIQKPKETPLIPDPLDDILVYPNPNSGEFVVSYTLNEKGNIAVDIYSSAGQLIFSESFMSESGSQRKQFNMPELAPGNYILSFKTNQKVYSRNFIIHQ